MTARSLGRKQGMDDQEVKMLQGAKYNYKITKRRHKGASTSPRMMVAVVKGLPVAERMVERLNRNRTEEEKEAGLRFSCQRTTDPVSTKG